MSASQWREHARDVIEQAIAQAKALKLDEKATRRLISDVYPFGVRKYHPYRIWLDEVKRALAVRARRQPPVFGGAIVDTHDYNKQL